MLHEVECEFKYLFSFFTQFLLLLKVFDGNCDHVTPVLNILESAQIARYTAKLFRALKLDKTRYQSELTR